jgi:hypothetical protein
MKKKTNEAKSAKVTDEWSFTPDGIYVVFSNTKDHYEVSVPAKDIGMMVYEKTPRKNHCLRVDIKNSDSMSDVKVYLSGEDYEDVDARVTLAGFAKQIRMAVNSIVGP